MRNYGSLLPVFLDNYFIEGLDQVAMEITSAFLSEGKASRKRPVMDRFHGVLFLFIPFFAPIDAVPTLLLCY